MLHDPESFLALAFIPSQAAREGVEPIRRLSTGADGWKREHTGGHLDVVALY